MTRERISVGSLIASGQIDAMQRISALKLFPDYSKLYAVALPDMTAFLRAAKLPDLSGVIAASVPDTRKMLDASRMLTAALPDYTSFYASLDATTIIRDATRLATATQLADLSKLLSSVALKDAFPDYSKMFAGLDTASLFRDYAAAMPAAARVAEEYMVEEVLPEVEESPSQGMVGTRLAQLSDEERKRALGQVEKAIYAVLAITGYTTQTGAVIIAGPGLALASAFLVLWLILKASGEED